MTENQKRFADYYIQNSNATESYKLAYPSCKTQRTAESNGHRLLKNAEVKAYIEQNNAKIADDRIADAKEINEFWTQIMRDNEKDIKDRLKASELRGKAAGIFIEKVEHSGGTQLNVKIEVVD